MRAQELRASRTRSARTAPLLMFTALMALAALPDGELREPVPRGMVAAHPYCSGWLLAAGECLWASHIGTACWGGALSPLHGRGRHVSQTRLRVSRWRVGGTMEEGGSCGPPVGGGPASLWGRHPAAPCRRRRRNGGSAIESDPV